MTPHLIEKIIVYSNKVQKQKETKQTFLFENSEDTIIGTLPSNSRSRTFF